MAQTELPVPELAVRLFGAAAIEQSGLPLADRAAHRHALGLLALLATARGGLITRDKVVALLWPEGEPESVRHRLNVVIYELRRLLGRSAIVSVNDSLRLDPESVWVDVAQFTTAVQRGAMDAAFALYRGDFLDGFHLDDAQEFDEWIAGERNRLANELRRGLEQQAIAAGVNGDHESSLTSWRRLVQLDPLGTRPCLGLMRELAAGGDLTGAQLESTAHALRRQEQLGLGADPAVGSLQAELRRTQSDRVTTPDALLPTAGRVIESETAASHSARAAVSSPPANVAVQRRPMLAASMLVAAALVLLLALWPRLRGDRGVAEGSSRASHADVVILPFTVRGEERHVYLREGMAELLSITLDGAGPFRTADPHAVLAVARQDAAAAFDPASGARVAARFDAPYFVLGTVVEAGGRMDLRASLYGADGALRASALGSVNDGGELSPAVDSLTRQLIASLYPSGVERLTRLAVSTSASLAALKAYLDGEARARTGDHTGAVDAYRRATQADSTFALAWYRLAVALENTLQPRAARDASEGAVRHATRLPERDRLLVEGWRYYAAGHADSAESVYQRILDLYPNEVEAWLQAGEIVFHHAASRGQSIAVARPSFERVLALDPDHEAAHVHLARIAGQSRDLATLTRHTDYLIARRAGSGVALEMEALRAFLSDDRGAVAALRPRFVNEDSYTVLAMLMNLFHAGDVSGMEWCADLLREPARPVEVRVAGHIVRALLALSRGDRVAARSVAGLAESLDAARGLETRALIETSAIFEFDRAAGARVRDQLARAADADVAESFFLPDADRVRPLMRRWLLALLNAQLGDSITALRLAAELEHAPSPTADLSLGADLGAGVRAEVARLSGDTRGALALLDRIKERPTYQLVLPSPFEPRVRERFVKAQLLEASGRPSESKALFGAIGARSLYDLPYARLKR